MRTLVTCTGRNNIRASVIADSISQRGDRLTTFELEYPRFIHAEFMTHRMLSKNGASSRAIPVSKMIQNIKENPAIPVYWGKNQRGMQANEEIDTPVVIEIGAATIEADREEAWEMARDSAIQYAEAFAEAGYHKQNVNRLIEPFKMMKVVCSGTEFDNFFWLRCHQDAQHDIKELADTMYDAMQLSKPHLLSEGEYHLPYVTDEVYNECKEHTSGENPLKLALKVSASCCAQVSYRTLDTGIDKALRIYSQLVESTPIHASPFEHQARPYTISDLRDFHYGLSGGLASGLASGLTHMNRNGTYWSGNFRGWVQHRHEIPNNTCWSYENEYENEVD